MVLRIGNTMAMLTTLLCFTSEVATRDQMRHMTQSFLPHLLRVPHTFVFCYLFKSIYEGQRKPLRQARSYLLHQRATNSPMSSEILSPKCVRPVSGHYSQVLSHVFFQHSEVMYFRYTTQLVQSKRW